MDRNSLISRARALVRGRRLEVTNADALDGLAAEHRFLVHPDGSACPDGCDARPVPLALDVLEEAESEEMQGEERCAMDDWYELRGQ
jgi:hypothetical protein